MIAKSGLWAPVTASGGALICVMALAVWQFAWTPRGRLPQTPGPPASVAPPSNSAPQIPSPWRPPAAPEAKAPSAAAFGPRVDVARVMPNGDVVIAGRAEPGANVALLDSGEILMETQADPKTGEFVLLPRRLGAGAHNLSLRSASSSADAPTMESAVRAFSIAPQIKTANSGSQSLLGPAIGQAEPAPSEPGARNGEATIMRGDTLWRISRERLGRGALYPTIVHANSAKIRNPNLIYPDQTLTIP